jgi:hypothetical protein
MKLIGNILLLPIKLILIIGYILSLIGLIISTIFDYLSSLFIGTIISISILLVIASLVFYGTNIFSNPISSAILWLYILTLTITLIPILFKGLQSFFKKGIFFWF